MSNNTGGIGFFGALTLLFVGLKLTGHITWPWWLVFVPVWVPLALMVLTIGFMLFLGVIGLAIENGN